MTQRERRPHAEVERLTTLFDTPLFDEFTEAVKREATHHLARWELHDARKGPED